MIIKAGSYERVSSDEQAKEGFSLEVQGEKNTAHIAAQGWELFDRYIDAGKSAKDLKRPDMQRLLTDIDKGNVNIVVVHKLDRLTRNIGDLHELLMLFDKKEIKLVSIMENIDTSTAMGRMFVYMLGIFAQWYRENLSEEVIKGQKKRAENGLRNSATRPYGYEVLPSDLSLVINEEEAPIVQRIFQQFVNGWGRIKIARELNKEGIPARDGGIWYESVINSMIVNPTYIGAVHWKESGSDEEDRVITHGAHEPIISMELWEDVQNVVIRRREGKINTSSYHFPYSSIVKCAECGRSYHGKMGGTGKRYPTYQCSGKYRVIPCSARNVSETIIDRLFLEFIDSFQFESDQPERKLNEKDSMKEIKRLTKLLDDSDTKRKNYTRAMGSGKLDYTMFEELMDEENEKTKQWRKELSELQSNQQVSVKKVKDIVHSINNLKLNWKSISREQRKLLVQQLFEVLVVKWDGENWKITGYKLA